MYTFCEFGMKNAIYKEVHFFQGANKCWLCLHTC